MSRVGGVAPIAAAPLWAAAVAVTPPFAAAAVEAIRPRRLLELLTGGHGEAPLHRGGRELCVADEALTLRFASSLAEFGPKRSLFELHDDDGVPVDLSAGGSSSSTSRSGHADGEAGGKDRMRSLPPASAFAWSGGGRRRRSCRAEALPKGPRSVLQSALFPFAVERLRRVLVDHLERFFDLGRVYHDFYSGALAEHGGPLKQRPALVKKLSEFAVGEEGDPEGYAYPQGEATGPQGSLSPTAALELVGQFFYHAHNHTQCGSHSCGSGTVPVWHLARVAPLNLRRAFCNYYHFTTVALSRVVALLPTLQADQSWTVLVPYVNWKGQASAFISESLHVLGLEADRVQYFPPCQLVLADEVLIAGAGPRSAFGRGSDGRHRSVMIDIADRAPSRSVRAAVLRALPPRPGGANALLLIDRHERRQIANIDEVLEALRTEPLAAEGPLFCEGMTFAEQVSLFRGAAAVVAVHGACLSNSLYMPSGALVVDAVPGKNFMGDGVVMPLDCGVTWFWTLTDNVGVRYRALILADGDFDAATVQVPALRLRDILLKELRPVAALLGRREGDESAHVGAERSEDRRANDGELIGARGSTPLVPRGAEVAPSVAEALGPTEAAPGGPRGGSKSRKELRTTVAERARAKGGTLVARRGAEVAPGSAEALERAIAAPGGAFEGSRSNDTTVCKMFACPQFAIPSAESAGPAPSDVSRGGLCAAARGLPLDPASAKGEAPDRVWSRVPQECVRKMLSGSELREAFDCFEHAFQLRRAPGRGGGGFATTLRKLWHDCELLDHLALIGVETPGAAQFFRALFEAARRSRETRPDSVFEVRIPEGDERRALWARLYNTALYMPSAAGAWSRDQPTIVANGKLLVDAEARFEREGHAVVDGLLPEATLRDLQRLLQEASVYFYHPRQEANGGGHFFLGLLEDGLATPLLLDLVLALRQALPRTLGSLTFCEARAWKEDTSGLPAPAAGIGAGPGLMPGGATVAALLWVVPPEVTPPFAAAPLDFAQHGGGRRKVSYAANRLILWRDDCAGAAPRWQSVVGSREEGLLGHVVHLVIRFTVAASAGPGSESCKV